MLLGHKQFTGKGRFGRPSIERFPCADLRRVDVIVFIGQMGEDEITGLLIKSVRIGKKLAHCVIREVTVAGHDPLLDDPGVRADF